MVGSHAGLRHTQKNNRFNKYQFKQIINTITIPDSNTCIDLIIKNCDIILEHGTINLNISDHLPIYFIRKKAKTNTKKGQFHRSKLYKSGRRTLFNFST